MKKTILLIAFFLIAGCSSSPVKEPSQNETAQESLPNENSYAEDLKNADNANWFTFKFYPNTSKNPSPCVEALNYNQQNVEKFDACKIYQNGKYIQSYQCQDKTNTAYVKGFVKGKNLCERTRETFKN